MFSVTKKFSSTCKDIADAIRNKLGIDIKIKLKDFPNYIEAINSNEMKYIIEQHTYSPWSLYYLGSQSFNLQLSQTSRLNKIIMPNSLEIGSSAFTFCSNLETIELNSCSKIQNDAFAHCTQLNYISIPKCQVLMSYAFQECENLSMISLPEITEISPGAFLSCIRLIRVYLLNSIFCNLTGNAFSSTPIAGYTNWTQGAIGAIYVPSSLLSIYQSATNWASLSSVIYPIPPSMYSIHNSILDIKNIFSKTINYLKYNTSFSNSFYISKISSAILMLQSKTLLTHFYDKIISSYYDNSIKIISRTRFFKNFQVSIYSFPSCTTINSNAFNQCFSLVSIDLPACTTIGSSAFYKCSSLTSINNLSQCATIYEDAFAECINLTSINLPVCGGLKSGTFENCSSLTTINLPLCSYLQQSVFSNCSSLSIVNLPACNNIPSSIFMNCSSLTSINLSACMTINGYAFANCYCLKSLYLSGSSVCQLISTNAFNSTPISTYSTIIGRYGSIFVPSSLFDAYQNATNWAIFASRFATIEDNPLPSEFAS